MYADEQIRQADAALKLLHGKSGFTYGHELWQVMSHAGKDANAMRSRMVKELGLISREGDNYQITEEGEKAYEMGFKAWLEERERKKSEPLPVKNIKPESEKRLEKWLAWGGIIGGIAAGIDIILNLLKLL